ncbi:MAG TPA: hypothetical protein VLB45_03260 [Nitrosopumilaceae archaeon]|nr:hypothetical protein [Nitrosopumilaceae archaeon]
MKKKSLKSSKKGTYVSIMAGAIIIGIVIIISYYTDQAKISGQRFGNDLEQIQSDLKKIASEYESNFTMWEEGRLTKQEILEISDNYLIELEKIISRYGELTPPPSFAPSLDLFKRSVESQLESDRMLKEWIQTGDNAAKIKSDELLQQAFEYETSALASFNRAKISNTQ